MPNEPSRAARSAAGIPDASTFAGKIAASASRKVLALVPPLLAVMNLGGASYYLAPLRESAVGLPSQNGTVVALSCRSGRSGKVKDRDRANPDEAVHRGDIDLLINRRLRDIREDPVVLEVAGRRRFLTDDEVILRVGGGPPVGFLQRAGVRMLQQCVPIPRTGEAAVG